MCATSHAWPKDFARCFPAMSVAPSRCSFSACVVGLIFLTSLSPRCRGLQHTISAPLFRRLCWPIFFFWSLRRSAIAAQGFQNNTSSSRGSERWWWFTALYLWRAQKLLCLHESFVSPIARPKMDRWLVLFPLKPCCCWATLLCGWMWLNVCGFPWLFYYLVLIRLSLWYFTVGCGCLCNAGCVW